MLWVVKAMLLNSYGLLWCNISKVGSSRPCLSVYVSVYQYQYSAVSCLQQYLINTVNSHQLADCEWFKHARNCVQSVQKARIVAKNGQLVWCTYMCVVVCVVKYCMILKQISCCTWCWCCC